MAKISFANNLINNLKKDLEKSVIVGVEKAKEIVHEESARIYEEFEPKLYERRNEDGGFQDFENIKAKLTSTTNTHTVEILNDTMFTTHNGDELYLDYFIEEGIYDWNRQPPPRPFIERSQQRIDDGEVTKVINNELRSRGYNV